MKFCIPVMSQIKQNHIQNDDTFGNVYKQKEAAAVFLQVDNLRSDMLDKLRLDKLRLNKLLPRGERIARTRAHLQDGAMPLLGCRGM